jgi:hypothetical protein
MRSSRGGDWASKTNLFAMGYFMAEHATERQIPQILIGVGLACYAISAFVHAGTRGVMPVLTVVAIGALIQTILLISAAFIVASFLSVSFGDFNSAIVKFCAATLLSGGLGAIIPMGGIVSAVIFLALILWLFELELPYAIALTVVYFLLTIAVAVVLRGMMG